MHSGVSTLQSGAHSATLLFHSPTVTRRACARGSRPRRAGRDHAGVPERRHQRIHVRLRVRGRQADPQPAPTACRREDRRQEALRLHFTASQQPMTSEPTSPRCGKPAASLQSLHYPRQKDDHNHGRTKAPCTTVAHSTHACDASGRAWRCPRRRWAGGWRARGSRARAARRTPPARRPPAQSPAARWGWPRPRPSPRPAARPAATGAAAGPGPGRVEIRVSHATSLHRCRRRPGSWQPPCRHYQEGADGPNAHVG